MAAGERMEAGAEMDARVAVAMGIETLWSTCDNCRATYHAQIEGCADCGGPVGYAHPPFSTDLGSAWLVVERITDPTSGLRNPSTGFPSGTHFGHWFDRAGVWAMSSHEAAVEICRAALAALAATRPSGEGE